MSASSDQGLMLLGGAVVMPFTDGLRPTTDTVLLAAAMIAEPDMHILDAGSGSGGAGLCLASRVPGLRVTALEREAAPAQAARKNVTANDFGDRIDVVERDLACFAKDPRSARFDGVITNPPYLDPASSRGSPDPLRRAATLESMPLDAWLGACMNLLKPNGEMVVVHRADRADELAEVLDRSAGSVTIMELRAGGADDAAARRVLVRARMGERKARSFARPLVLHRADGSNTDAAEAILRHGAALDWVALGPCDTK
jgi:tRNA1(Val) A37 N6-methylase TrmN6